MKASRRNRANPPLLRVGVPPVSKYAVKAYGEEAARASHASLWGPKAPAKAEGVKANG